MPNQPIIVFDVNETLLDLENAPAGVRPALRRPRRDAALVRVIDVFERRFRVDKSVRRDLEEVADQLIARFPAGAAVASEAA